MTERIWHKGPPPHVGWWNASNAKIDMYWRWWDGRGWSQVVGYECTAEDAGAVATTRENNTDPVEWTDYWPENARVPRADPRPLRETEIEHFNRACMPREKYFQITRTDWRALALPHPQATIQENWSPDPDPIDRAHLAKLVAQAKDLLEQIEQRL